MNRLNRYALSVLAVSVSAAILAGVNATPLQSQMGSAPVTVVNTPLPVTGSVAIGSSTTLPVSISGTPDVRVTNFPTRTPYHFAISTGFEEQATWDIPSGKIFEMKYVSCYGSLGSDASNPLRVILQAGEAGNQEVLLTVQVPQTGSGDDNQRTYNFAQPTHAFVGPVSNKNFGSTIKLNASVAGHTDGAVTCYVAGELLN